MKKKSSYRILAIVAIVAIVALFNMFRSDVSVHHITVKEDLSGLATGKFHRSTIKIEDLPSEVKFKTDKFGRAIIKIEEIKSSITNNGCEASCPSAEMEILINTCSSDGYSCSGDVLCMDEFGIPYVGTCACDYYDECGECWGDNSSCLDCNGDPNGGAVEDACGVCGGNQSYCCTYYGASSEYEEYKKSWESGTGTECLGFGNCGPAYNGSPSTAGCTLHPGVCNSDKLCAPSVNFTSCCEWGCEIRDWDSDNFGFFNSVNEFVPAYNNTYEGFGIVPNVSQCIKANNPPEDCNCVNGSGVCGNWHQMKCCTSHIHSVCSDDVMTECNQVGSECGEGGECILSSDLCGTCNSGSGNNGVCKMSHGGGGDNGICDKGDCRQTTWNQPT